MSADGSSHGQKTAAYKTVSLRVKVTEKTVRNWVSDFEMMTIVRESRRGKHSKTMSPIADDPEFKLKFKEYVKTNSRKQGKYVLKHLNQNCAGINVNNKKKNLIEIFQEKQI